MLCLDVISSLVYDSFPALKRVADWYHFNCYPRDVDVFLVQLVPVLQALLVCPLLIYEQFLNKILYYVICVTFILVWEESKIY